MWQSINHCCVFVTVVVLGISAGCAIAVLASFFLYFKASNASFLAAAMPAAELSAALAEWANWQWARIALGVGAFAAALIGAMAVQRQPASTATPS